MCGRLVGFGRIEALMEAFPVDVTTVAAAERLNVAPTREVLAIVRHDGRNHLEWLSWGLVPVWAKDTRIGTRMINARPETAATKPSFRTAFRRRRCLILADGFYEWAGGAGRQQPIFLTLPDGRPFAFAGLWEIWDDRGREAVPHRSCTILTREASPSVRPIHHRMPVILRPEAFGAWLDPANRDVDSLHRIIQTQIHTELKGVPVSPRVDATRNNGPETIGPIDGPRSRHRPASPYCSRSG